MSDELIIDAVLITNEHLLDCRVQTNGERLSDVLNKEATKFLRIFDVSVMSRQNNSPPKKLNDGVIRKPNILLAILKTADHEAPERRINSFAAKNHFESFILVDGFQIKGQLHAKGEPEGVQFLTHHTLDFIPITNAEVSYSDGSDPMNAQSLFVNKAAIDFLQMLPNQEGSEDFVSAIRELMHEHI